MKDEKPTLANWLGYKAVNTQQNSRLGAFLGWSLVALVLLIALPTLWEFLKAVTGLDVFTNQEAQSAAIRNTGLALAAMVGVPFVIWRTSIAQKQADVAEQGHITDRINTAVQGLGALKTVKTTGAAEETKPNFEVRIGAIYALERIAQDSDRDHVQIMEILCAYIRENAKADKSSLTPKDATLKWANDLPPPRADIKTAVKVVSRRSKKQIDCERRFSKQHGGDPVVNLAGVNLQRLDLPHANFTFCQMPGCSFQGAILNDAIFEDSILVRSRFDFSFLHGAIFTRVKTSNAKFMGALLSGARFSFCDLFEAQVQSAVIIQNAAQPERNRPDTVFWGSNLCGANFSNVQSNAGQIKQGSVFLDQRTILPAGTKLPPTFDYVESFPGIESRLYTQWRDWQKSISTPPAKSDA